MLYTYLILENYNKRIFKNKRNCDVSNCTKFLEEYEKSRSRITPLNHNEEKTIICMPEKDFNDDEKLIEHVKRTIEDTEECIKGNCEKTAVVEEGECPNGECRRVDSPIPIRGSCSEMMQPRTKPRCNNDMNRRSLVCSQILPSTVDPPCPKSTVDGNLPEEACDRRRGTERRVHKIKRSCEDINTCLMDGTKNREQTATEEKYTKVSQQNITSERASRCSARQKLYNFFRRMQTV